MQINKQAALVLGPYAEAVRAKLFERYPGFDWYTSDEVEAASSALHSVTAVFAFNSFLPKALFERLPNLRWVQGLTSGVDLLERLTSQRPDLTLTSAQGIHGPQMAEMAVFQMFMLARKGSQIVQNQQDRKWVRWEQPVLLGKTVLIVGVGTVGRALAQRCRAFGMNVFGVVSSPREEADFNQLFMREQLADALALADFTVVLTPYSSETRDLFDENLMGHMKPGSFLINLSRGEVVKQSALIEALANKKLSGAALDVFEQEPLPPDHPYWTTPGIFLTPHLGGMSDIYPDQLMPILQHNIDAFLKQDFDSMTNLVQRKGMTHVND